MRQAIVTKFMGPTDHRGARVKARCEAGTLTISWDDAQGVEENHSLAAWALANKFGWLEEGWTLHGGGLPSKDGNCYVLVKS